MEHWCERRLCGAQVAHPTRELGDRRIELLHGVVGGNALAERVHALRQCIRDSVQLSSETIDGGANRSDGRLEPGAHA